MRLEIFPDLRRILVHAASTEHALDLRTKLATKRRKTGCDRGVIHLHVEVLNDRLFGQAKSVRRIGPCNEGIRVAVLGTLDDGRQVRSAERVGLVVNDIIPGFLQTWTSRLGKLYAKRVCNIDHCNPVADRAGVTHVIQDIDHRLGEGCGVAESEEQVVVTRGQLRSLVGYSRNRNVRIVILGVDWRCSKVEAGAVRRDDEIDLVDFGKTLCRLDVFTRVCLVVVFDDFNHHLLATDIQTTAGVNLF